NPVVVAATPNLATVTDANVGPSKFTLALQYSVPMLTTVNPTITFNPSVGTALAFAAGSWDATHTVYTASYNVADTGATIPGVGISVSGAQGAGGIPQTAFTQTSVFAINTLNPSVASITSSVPVITDALTGSATFTLAIQYAKVM